MEHYANLLQPVRVPREHGAGVLPRHVLVPRVSKKVETAIGLGMAVVFVQVLTVPLNNLILRYLLAEGALAWISPCSRGVDLSFLAFIVFIGTIAAATQIVEMVIDRFSPALYRRSASSCR